MKLLEDRRVLIAGGAAGAVLLGALIAAFIMGKDKPAPAPEPAAKGALQVELGEQQKLNPNQQLRCFVGGQFIGSATLAECARKNGVAAQSLDVGIDQSGALAAGGDQLKPLPAAPPPVQVAEAPPLPVPTPPPVTPVASSGPTGECLRYGPEGWRPTGGAPSLSACVRALFDGQCKRAGEAVYGRWADQTLRLVPGKVEASTDNRTFHTLVEQNRDCSIPQL